MTKIIAFVSDAIWPYNKGGKEKRLFDISTRLVKGGHDVHIYTMKWWPGPNVIKENGVTLHAISKLYPLYSKDRRSIKEGIVFGLACLRLITANWDVIDVDHMPFFPLFSVKLICLLKRKKMIATWHEVWGRDYWLKYMGTLGYVSDIIEKLSVLMPDKIISVSDHTTNKLKNELFFKKEIITISDGIDVGHIKSIKPSAIKSDVIFAGRLLSHKNVDMLIKSIAILKNKTPNIMCLIIGEGPEKSRLEELTQSLNLTKNVIFLGFLENHDKLLSFIKSSKVFVLPSTREGFGICVIESFACNTPVITIDGPDNAAKNLIITGTNGYLTKPDEKNLAQNINLCLKRKNYLIFSKSLSGYDWTSIMNNFKEVYSI